MANKSRDEGSVLLWVVGCAAVGLLVVVATSQIVAVMHQHRALQYATDKAILAAANRLDLQRFMNTGVISDIDVSSAVGRDAAVVSLNAESFDCRIEYFVVTNRVVVLRTSRALSSPLGWGTGDRIYAEASVSVTRMP